MATIIKRNKALSVSPLKASSCIGAALAFLGFNRSIPMLHGSQGCTAFGKVFFVRHFREPIPLQTTAMDQISTVLNSDDNVIEGLRTICENSAPDMIGIPTTGLSETQGSDVVGVVNMFRQRHPEYNHIAVVPVSTPDYVGCLETGYAKAVKEMIANLVPQTPGECANDGDAVVILPSSALSPGDVEAVKQLVEQFDLRPIMLPDLSNSLDGHLPQSDFSPLTTGGTPISAFTGLDRARAVISLGASMAGAAQLLGDRTGLPVHCLDHLMGMRATDRFILLLSDLSGKKVPDRLTRSRRRLQDAMMDCHFHMGLARYAVAADPDLLAGFTELLHDMGGDVVAAVSPVNAPVLSRLSCDSVKIGDLEDLEKQAASAGAQLVIGNSHAVASAERLGVPVLRAGFPQYDLIGGFARAWVGYDGARAALFDLANLLVAEQHGEVAPYKSIYSQKPDYREDTSWHSSVA